jgi:hypothetical protein
MRKSVAPCILVGICACSSPSGGDAGDAGSDGFGHRPDAAADDAGDVTYPAPHPAYARVASLGGSTLHNPTVRAVYFAHDPFASQLDALIGGLGLSKYWGTTTSEYSVGPLSAGPSITRTDAPPASTTQTDVEAWLAAQLDGTHAGWGTADPSTVYLLYYPSSSKMLVGTRHSCTDLGGYHEQIAVGGIAIPYAVVFECADLAFATQLTTHEIIEAVTDPFPDTAPAWTSLDKDHMPWMLIGGSEVGDMCESASGLPLVGQYSVVTTWSNASLVSGGAPCVPDDGPEPYFNSAPVLTDTCFPMIDQTFVKSPCMRVPVGQSKTIDVDLFSMGPTSARWSVRAQALPQNSGTAAPNLGFTWDQAKGQNGDVLHLTVTANAAGPGLFAIFSRLGKQQYFWFVYVEN